MNHQPYLNLIGLAFKAGKCVVGEENILNSIRSNNVKLLLIANDCGENTAKRLTDKCKTFAIPYMEADSRECLVEQSANLKGLLLPLLIKVLRKVSRIS